MQYDPVRLADQPANGVTCGIDWARDDHAITVIDSDARVVYHGVVEHSAKGLKDLITVLTRTGVEEVAIERADGPVVEALLGAGLTVVVVNPTRSRTCGAAMGRPAIRMTVSTRSCWPTRCAPIAPDCIR